MLEINNKMVKREKYISEIRGFYDDDLVKIITGIRRCGKSVVLSQIQEEIQMKSDNIIYLDFEDRAISGCIPDADSLLKYVNEKRKKNKCYVFLDEVQRLDDWASACRTLRLHDCSVFISGSNSKLLSKEFTKELSGRYVAFQIKPFVFKEIDEYYHTNKGTPDITDYLVWGGFPKRFDYSDKGEMRRYLNDLFETIIYNDIVTRYKIKKTNLFRKLINYVFVTNSRIFSARAIYRYLSGNGTECSPATIIKYLGYMEEAFAIESISQYSKKNKRQLSYYKKIYDQDVAMNSIYVTDNRYDLTHNLENVIYNELLYRGYSLSVYDEGSAEIDFLAEKNGKRIFIQVAYSVQEEKAYEREFKAFNKMDNSARKVLITNDDLDYSTSTVEHIKLKDFLLSSEV